MDDKGTETDFSRLKGRIVEFATVVRDGDDDREQLLNSASALHAAVETCKQDTAATSAETEQTLASIDRFKSDIERTLWSSHELINRHVSLLEADEGFAGLEPSVESLREILKFSHRLAYSTFAPNGYEMGDPLLSFKPPAPQAAQFLASKLHDYDEKYRRLNEAERERSSSDEGDQFIEGPGKRVKTEEGMPSATVVAKEVEDAMETTEIETDPLVSPPSAMEQTLPETVQPAVPSFLLNPDLEDDEDESSSTSSTGNSD